MESLPYFCYLPNAVGFMLLANILWWKKRGLMNSVGHNIFLIFRLLHSGEIARSKPAASYLMHWLAPRNLIISTVAFLIIKYIMPIHLPVLKTGALYLQGLLCYAWHWLAAEINLLTLMQATRTLTFHLFPKEPCLTAAT